MADNSPYCWLVPFIFGYSNYTAAVANGVNSKQQAVGGTTQVRTRLRYSKNEKPLCHVVSQCPLVFTKATTVAGTSFKCRHGTEKRTQKAELCVQ